MDVDRPCLNDTLPFIGIHENLQISPLLDIVMTYTMSYDLQRRHTKA